MKITYMLLFEFMVVNALVSSCGETRTAGPRTDSDSSTNEPSNKSHVVDLTGAASELIPVAARPGVYTVQIVPKTSEAWTPPKTLTFKRVINWGNRADADGDTDSRNYAVCGEAMYTGKGDPALSGKIIAYLKRVDPAAAYNRELEMKARSTALNRGANQWPKEAANMRMIAYVGRCSYLLFSSVTHGGSIGGLYGQFYEHPLDSKDSYVLRGVPCSECKPYRIWLPTGGVFEDSLPMRIEDDQQFVKFFPRAPNLQNSIRFAASSYTPDSRNPERIYGKKVANGYNRFRNDGKWAILATGWQTIEEPSKFQPMNSLPGWECAESPGIYFVVSRIRKVPDSRYHEILGTCSDYTFAPPVTLASGLQCWDVQTNELIKLKSMYLSTDGIPIFNDDTCAKLQFPVVESKQRKSMCVGIFDSICVGDPAITGVIEFGSFRDQLGANACRETIQAAAAKCGPVHSAMAFNSISVEFRKFQGCEISTDTCHLNPALAGKVTKTTALTLETCTNDVRNLAVNQCGHKPGERMITISFGREFNFGNPSKYIGGPFEDYDPIIEVQSSVSANLIKVGSETLIPIVVKQRYPRDSFGFGKQLTRSNADWVEGVSLTGGATNDVVSVDLQGGPTFTDEVSWDRETGRGLAGNTITYLVRVKASANTGRFSRQIVLNPWHRGTYEHGTISPEPITKKIPVYTIKLTGRVVSGASPWQNPLNAYDVNNDGVVNSTDSLRIINDLNRSGPRDLNEIGPKEPNISYLDVNGDFAVNSLDSLTIVNYLNREQK